MEQTAEYLASGNWHVTEGKEQEFVERWTEFLSWTRETQPALVRVSLNREENDPRHFVSFAEWKSAAGRAEWKQSPGFTEHFSACRSLCEEFYGGDYSRLVTI